MKINSVALGTAFATATAIVWFICSLLVVFMPGLMMTTTGHMMHADFGTTSWTMSFFGFFTGLVIWSLTAFAIGWLIGVTYNKLTAA